jgi:hypothetical protein
MTKRTFQSRQRMSAFGGDPMNKTVVAVTPCSPRLRLRGRCSKKSHDSAAPTRSSDNNAWAVIITGGNVDLDKSLLQ